MYRMLFVAFIILSMGCGSEDEGGTVKAPFEPVSQTTTVEYKIERISGGSAKTVIRYAGKTTFNNREYEDYKAVYQVAEGEKTTHIYGELLSPTSARVAGYKVVYPQGATNTDYTVTLDEPVLLDANEAPVGVEQTKEASGQITFADNRPPIKGKVSARYTKTTDNASFEAEFGTLSGVQVFEGSATLLEGEGWDLLDLFKGKSVSGKVYFHPKFSILKVEVPDWPIGAAMTGEHDCGNPAASDYNIIQKVGVVSNDNLSFVLSSYDCSGQFDADKMRHAQMLVELRWAEGEKARTNKDLPLVVVNFETMWGYFPHRFEASPISIFHPEENGQGYTFWYAYVDEAAKNEPGPNGIAYQVRVNYPDYMTSPVRVTARIKYPIFRQ